MSLPQNASPLRRCQSESSNSVASFKSASSRGLLFGEIPKSDEQAEALQEGIKECRVILCGKPHFMKFWDTDAARDRLLSRHCDKKTLATLRLVCHDMKTRCAPALFEDITISFKAESFTKPRRIRALDRIARHIETVTFHLPQTLAYTLPPLVHPHTGDQLSFTYTPQVKRDPKSMDTLTAQAAPLSKFADEAGPRSKFGDETITELLIQQYEPAFHAATNIDSFIRAFRPMRNLQHLRISCPPKDPLHTSSRRTIVDYALLSLRMAIERNVFEKLNSLSLLDVHWTALQDLLPLLGPGSTPKSAKTWSQVQNLKMEMTAPHWNNIHHHEHLNLLQSYLRSFSKNLRRLTFDWLGEQGPYPFASSWDTPEEEEEIRKAEQHLHPAVRQYFSGLDLSSRSLHSRSGSSDSKSSTESSGSSRSRRPRSLHFPHLTHLQINNALIDADQVSSFLHRHRHVLQDLKLKHTDLRSGGWEEAFNPASRLAKRSERREIRAEIRRFEARQEAARRPRENPSAREPLFSMASMDVPCMLSRSAMPSMVFEPPKPSEHSKPLMPVREVESPSVPAETPVNKFTSPPRRVEPWPPVLRWEQPKVFYLQNTYYDPIIEGQLLPEPPVDTKEPGLIASLVNKILHRHVEPVQTDIAAEPLPIREHLALLSGFSTHQPKPKPVVGHLRQFFTGNFFHPRQAAVH